MRPGAIGGAVTYWQRWPGHVAVAKPPCTRCRRPAMRWNRCACGEVFALCADCPGFVVPMRNDHAERCPAAIACGGYR